MADSATRVFRERLGRIDQLLEYFEHDADPAAQTRARELIQLLLDLNADGIERMLQITGEDGEGAAPVLDRLLDDELVSSLLVLHGLHPIDLQTRVRQALERVRPYMVSHGGDISLSGIDSGGVLRITLEGSCDGCPASRETVSSRIEEAVYGAAPEITAIRVETAASGPASRVRSEESRPSPPAPAQLPAGSGKPGTKTEET